LPSTAAYDLQRTFDVEVAALVGAVFTVPQLVALFVEGPFLIWAERWPRERLLVGGLLGMALATLLCALAPGVWGVALGCTVYFPASGVACGIAQAALMDSDPARREQRMAEWAMAGWAGDLITPMLLAASSELGLGWRGAFVAVAASLCLAGAAVLRVELPTAAADVDEDESDLALRQKLALLFGERRLLWWLCGVTLCSLLDEIFAVFAGIWIWEAAGPVAVATTLTAFTAGGVAGLLVTKPLLHRFSSRAVLLTSCVGCTATFVGWLCWGAGALGFAAMFVCGLFVALQYPIAQAAAYRALPGRSTLVAAAGSLFGGLELLIPLLLGWVVDGFGVVVGLSVLLLQPVGLFFIALLVRVPK